MCLGIERRQGCTRTRLLASVRIARPSLRRLYVRAYLYSGTTPARVYIPVTPCCTLRMRALVRDGKCAAPQAPCRRAATRARSCSDQPARRSGPLALSKDVSAQHRDAPSSASNLSRALHAPTPGHRRSPCTPLGFHWDARSRVGAYGSCVLAWLAPFQARAGARTTWIGRARAAPSVVAGRQVCRVTRCVAWLRKRCRRGWGCKSSSRAPCEGGEGLLAGDADDSDGGSRAARGGGGGVVTGALAGGWGSRRRAGSTPAPPSAACDCGAPAAAARRGGRSRQVLCCVA